MTRQVCLVRELQGYDGLGESVVERLPIGSMVGSAVTCRAYACDVPWVVGPSVAQAADMVRFQVGASGSGHKRSGEVTGFADPVCASEHIVANIPCSLVGGSGCRQCGRGSVLGSFVSARTQVLETRHRCRPGRDLRRLPINLEKRVEREHDSLARQLVTSLLRLELPSGADELPFESDRSAFHVLREDEEILPIRHMISDRAIPALHGHGSGLALARVKKRSVSLEPVVISSNVSTHLVDGENHREFSGRAYASLLLSPKGPVQVVPSRVRPMRNKRPMHSRMVRVGAPGNKEACA